jgi:hypothetical protein
MCTHVGVEVETSRQLKAGRLFFELSRVKAKSGPLKLEGYFRPRGGAQSSVFRLGAGPLSFGVGINDEMDVFIVGSVVEQLLEVSRRHIAWAM